MNIINIKYFFRFLILSWNYKLSCLSFFLRIIGHIPFFSYSIKRIEDSINDGIHSKGHITKGKKIYLNFFNFSIIQFDILKGETLTAEHFYFNRSIKDIKDFLKASNNYLNIDKNSIIFDPACGTGKHLLHITDTYNCKGIGVDIYPKAINVAKKIENFSNCKFILGNSCDNDTLFVLKDLSNNKKINMIFINSWLSYVHKNRDFVNFFNYIKQMQCKIMIIAQKKDDLKSIFKTNKILYQKLINNTQYAILEL